MPTITIEVSELVLALREVYEKEGHTQESFADALGVGRQRAANWIKGHNDIDMSRSLQLRIALMLGITPTEVLELHGFEVSDEVPEPDEATLAGDSPRPPQSQNGTTHGDVVPIDTGRHRLAEVVELPGMDDAA